MVDQARIRLAGYAVAGLVVLVLGGKWALAGRAQAGGGTTGAGRSAAAVSVRPAAPRAAVVQVVGAVRHPGVYRVSESQRVQAAVRRAGGLTPAADASAVNLAAKVTDGAQIVVPRRGAAASAAASGVPGASVVPGASGPPVNLNTATPEQLDALDGIGPTMAAKIVEYRRQHGGFGSIRDLDRIPGIGPKRLAALKGKVTA